MIIYIFLIIQHLAYASQTSCTYLITKMMASDPNQLFVQSLPYITKSGTGINKWGDYKACIDAGYTYSNMVLTGSPLGYSFIGICHHSDCTTKDLNNNIAPIKIIIQQLIGFPLPIAGFVDGNSLTPQIGPGFVIVIILLIVLLCLALALPLYKLALLYKFRKPRYQKEYKANLNVNQNSEHFQSIDADIYELVVSQIQKNPSKLVKFLSFFSIVENFRSMARLTTPDPQLSIFNGIRSIAFIMVVFGHQYSILLSKVDVQVVLIYVQQWMGVILLDMLYSVDIFFWIGGFFLGFVMAEQKKVQFIKKARFFGVLQTVIHRVLRIWPCYIIAILLYWQIYPQVGNGPRWIQEAPMGNACSKFWRNLLFIDNLFNDQYYCMGWSWYLSNDMQLFLVSLIPMYIYAVYSPMLGKAAIGILLILTNALSTYITFHYDYLIPFYSMSQPDFFNKYYTKPWCRGAPYFLGLLLGVLYREFKAYQKNPSGSKPFFNMFTNIRRWIIQLTCYLFGFGIVGILMFAWRPAQVNGPQYWNKTFQEIWNSFCRVLFCLGLSFIAFPNFIGLYDWFNTSIMNCSMFKFLAKISFTGYLIHYMVISLTSSTFYEAPEFTNFSNIQFFIGNLTLSILLAILMHLLVEIPFSRLEVALMSKLQKKNERKKSIEHQLLGDEEQAKLRNEMVKQ